MMNYWTICLYFFVLIIFYAETFNINELVKEDKCNGPGSDPRKNHYFNGKCHCKKYVKGKFCSDCKKYSFHLSSNQPDGCLKCQCSLLSKNCHSAELYMDKIHMKFQNESHGAKLLLGDSSVISPTPEPSSEYMYAKDLQKTVRGSFYWNLPENFTGDKLTSYGGFLAYQTSYILNSKEKLNTTNDALAILKGNGITLMHFARPQLEEENEARWYLIPLWEQYWSRAKGESSSIITQLSNTSSDYRCSRKKKRARRKHMIRVLTNIDSIMIKANLHSFATEVRLHQIMLTAGTTNSSTGKRIFHVEQCQCPLGYDGLSCQYCSEGYKKVYSATNPLGFACVGCECNGNSLECNQLTGICLNCQNNTTGEFCERKILHCDEAGTQEMTSDRCVCKSRVTGEFCTECKRGFFNQSPDNNHVCERCWCNGVTAKCKSTRNGRIIRPIKPSYINLQTSYGNKMRLIEAVEAIDGEAVRVCKDTEKVEHWFLPKVATGNLLKSYGGNIGFSVSNEGSCPEYSTTHKPFVRLEGYRKLLHPTVGYIDWIFKKPILRTATSRYKVKLHETQFVDMYNSKVNRNTFLKFLSSVKHIKIYIPDCTSLKLISIKDITLDVLDQSIQGGAPEVEDCSCPLGYVGLSCENCAKGYIRHNGSNHCKRKY